MKEKTLIAIAIICSLAGVFALYIISESISINESTIEKINNGKIGSNVKLNGVVKDVFSGNKSTIITITKPEEVKVIFYEKGIGLQKGDYVEIIGETEEYNGEVNIMGNRVRKIS